MVGWLGYCLLSYMSVCDCYYISGSFIRVYYGMIRYGERNRPIDRSTDQTAVGNEKEGEKGFMVIVP